MIYKSLQEKIVKNVCENFEDTGYFWENFDENNGTGNRSHPFTGWTAVVTLIANDIY